MLWQRVLTAIPLAVAAIWFILSQSSEALLYAMLVITLISGWEWSRLAGIANLLARAVYAVSLTLAVYFSHVALQYQPSLFEIIMSVSVVWWLMVIYRMATRGPSAPSEETSAIKLLVGFVTLVPAVLALVKIHSLPQGAYWVLYTMSIIWVADIGAYFSGRRFGKVKLAPQLSPGKTREGLYGALVATSIYTMGAAVLFELGAIEITLLLIIAFFATLLSVAGDLFISLLKRERGVKDSGHILPGHGGILDRIDSITSSAPFFALLLDLMIFNV